MTGYIVAAVGRKNETVGLITDLTPEQLPAAQGLKANRQAWGIENGTHQRLDVSLHDDRCRVRNTHALWILGMLRRRVISLFMRWRARHAKPHHQSLTDFQSDMGENNLAKALAFLTQQRPKLRTPFQAYALGRSRLSTCLLRRSPFSSYSLRFCSRNSNG